MSSILLSTTDFHSITWKKIEAAAEARLARFREMNDHPQSAEDTALLRGRISELRWLLAQPAYLERDREDARQEIELGDVSAMY